MNIKGAAFTVSGKSFNIMLCFHRCSKDALSRLQFLLLIAYGSVTWGSTSLSNIKRLSKLQKRAARIILHAEYTTPSVDMFNELG